MRIAQLSSMTGFYGGEVHLAALAAGLAARGHEVRAVVRPGSALADRLAAAGIPVATLPLVDWYEPVGTLRLRTWLRRHRIDILHTHVPRDWYTAAVATLGTGTVNLGTRHRLEPVGAPALKRPFLGRFARLLAVSDAVRARLLPARLLPPGRVVTVPNGVAVPAAPGDRAAARRRLGLDPDPRVPVVGFVGRLAPDKGLPVLLEAIARLRVRRPAVRLAVVGDDPAGGRCARDLAARADAAGLGGTVRWLGYRPDAADLCRAFDVQAVPSAAEPFGLVVLEALAQGVPVVATGTGGVPEIVRDGREALLVPPGDAAALAGALEALLDDPARRRALGAAGRERVAAAFGLDRMVDRVEGVCRAVLQAPGSRVSPAAAARPAPRRR